MADRNNILRVVPLRQPVDSGEPAPKVAVATSAGIREIRFLREFLAVDQVLSPAEAQRAGVVGDVVVAWGRKPSARLATQYAQDRDIPLLFLEDGWIRSCSENSHSATCYSMLVDSVGVYYDSSCPSELENILNDSAFSAGFDAEALERARSCRQLLVDNDVTKYNFCTEAVLPERDGRPLVLVVDQTCDDSSVCCGGMDTPRFKRMLDAAIDENPGAEIVVRTHPDVVDGRRTGYLADYAQQKGVTVCALRDNPMQWIKQADKVYVGTSQIGYEALMCEREVVVFGQPFYAGWGLSDDRFPVARRQQVRTIDELFHATHIRLARYVSPLTGEPWTLEDCLKHVLLQKEHFSLNAQKYLCTNMAPWKRRYVRRFLRSPDGDVRFGTPSTLRDDEVGVCWGFRDQGDTFPEDRRLRMEDGFVRSAGLGSDFTAPGSLVMDSSGLYFDPERPSDLETLLSEHECTLAELQRARRLLRRLLESGVSKYNVGSEQTETSRVDGRQNVLVVGQVEDDESLLRGCTTVASNSELLSAARQSRPDAWIVYRPHPDVESGNRRGVIGASCAAACADAIETNARIADSIDACDEVHTMTSLAGFEALMRNKRVVTWGAPFYAGWGLTEDQVTISRRSRVRTLDELLYISLILYPRYVDTRSGDFVDAETMVEIIAANRDKVAAVGEAAGWVDRQLVRLANIYKGLTYAP